MIGFSLKTTYFLTLAPELSMPPSFSVPVLYLNTALCYKIMYSLMETK